MKEKKQSNPVISICPVCAHELHVAKLECNHCDTTIEGKFTLSKFNYLETNKLYFIEIFIKNRGNIKAIEKELNISYPTVKKMLDDVIVHLGYKIDANDGQDIKKDRDQMKFNRANILDQIEKGKMSVKEAVSVFKKLKK